MTFLLQTIVFSRASDLADCLARATSDPDLQVLRVKNRLSRAFDSRGTAGYRDVAINFRFTRQSPAGAAAAVAGKTAGALGRGGGGGGGEEGCGHVCELLLLLLPFAEVKCESGHARYVQYRNAMGF